MINAGSTGALARMINKEVAPVGKVPKAAPAASAKFVPAVQRQRVIPGMAPPGATPVPKKPANVGAGSGKKTCASPAQSAPDKTKAVPAPALPVVETAESKEKRAKNINKKLKAIQEIRAKQEAGQVLEPEQVSVTSFSRLLCVDHCCTAGDEVEFGGRVIGRA